ncbi:MAG: prepilin-type N-terminal cleavage/methylation domain-containing protein [Verrucomicrobia bacterium]|jgi:prepilin-type N-terminal cleavage/methylation domain-containing protein|nr:prepilin-type N-terminal cleavage/methylation domain-containing protein [Verrucomicrobiota bacterium]
MRKEEKAGFSILELAVVLAILSVVAALAVPAFQNLLRESRLSTLANDLRVHAQAIDTHVAESGEYPQSHYRVGEAIPGLEGSLSSKWLETTPVGGGYTWIYTQQGDPDRRNGFIQIVERPGRPLIITLDDVRKFDKRIDDGNLAEGRLQLAGTRIRYYVRKGSD